MADMQYLTGVTIGLDKEELLEHVLRDVLNGLKELGMSTDDLEYVVCCPDEVYYPIQLENTVAWGFRLFYLFKDGRTATKRLEIFSQDCPITQFANYYDWGLEVAKRISIRHEKATNKAAS